MRRALPWLIVGLLVGCSAPTPGEENAYTAGIEQWRARREARLKSDTGWLTLAGLFWLEDGENTFGTDPSNDIVLPEGTTIPFAGTFELDGGRTTVRMKPGAGATVNGEPIETMVLRTDAVEETDVIAIGDRVTLYVIERGERFGIRVKDTRSRYRTEFKGLRWYPIKESYRITGRFVQYDPPHEVDIADVTGNIQKMTCPGKVFFELDGREMSLEPVLETPDEFFFVFSDATSGKETYGSGRFFYSDLPEGDRVVLDFNKAYNPPCAFTPYSTCPLPVPGNRLTVPIEAGELNYGNP